MIRWMIVFLNDLKCNKELDVSWCNISERLVPIPGFFRTEEGRAPTNCVEDTRVLINLCIEILNECEKLDLKNGFTETINKSRISVFKDQVLNLSLALLAINDEVGNRQ